MSDDQPDLELVSAYVDGEASADERARVEADPSLMAEVEQLLRLRRRLGEVEAPSPERREAAIAAALAAFEELDGGGSPAGAPTVVPFRSPRRGRWMQGLTAAAAAAVIIVGGIVIANRNGGDDDSTADKAREPALAAPAPTGRAAADATTEDAELAMELAPADPDDDDAEEAADAESAADDAAPPPPAGAPVPATTSLAGRPTTTGDAPMLAESPDEPPVLRTPEDLTEFASEMEDQPPSLDDVVEACDDGDVEPDAVYEDEDGVRVDVAVATAGDGYAAVSLDTCESVINAGV